MCLEGKKQKSKNDWFISTLKCSKQCTSDVWIRGWNKKRYWSVNVFRGFEAPRTVIIFQVKRHQQRHGRQFYWL